MTWAVGSGLLPRDRTWTIVCRSGMRAAIAASLMARAGHEVRVVVDGGVPDALAHLEERSRRAPGNGLAVVTAPSREAS